MNINPLYQAVSHEYRPERLEQKLNMVEEYLTHRLSSMNQMALSLPALHTAIVRKVNMAGIELDKLDRTELEQRVHEVQSLLVRDGLRESHVVTSFALIRQLSRQILGMFPFDVQVMGAKVILDGKVAEMNPGEGKTLTASLAAATMALAGVPVHVISVNDYLTARDADLLEPLYNSLGLSVGTIVQGMSPEERRQAYLCDITYCTNNEVTFDYLKDTITLGGAHNPAHLHAESLCEKNDRAKKLLLRGLHFAIVDEADSVLIDEARTPLIISRQTDNTEEQQTLQQALDIIDQLVEGEDYKLDSQKGIVTLLDQGKYKVSDLTMDLGPLWVSLVRREELIKKALTARYLFRRDEHYLVQDGKVQIIDQYTGRLMPDRSWEGGLQQLIELEEDCETSFQNETIARISYQRFFRRYLRLGGMTGTAREVRTELNRVYRLPVVAIPTNEVLKRKCTGRVVYATEQQKWQSIIERVTQLYNENRPILIGTRSVRASEKASQLLNDAGFGHNVLNAGQDEQEAEIVAQAGQPGTITVVTNMAGRGTDIKLPSESVVSGGLHVIIVERHEAGRIDRQLAGRSARQGEPGSYEYMVSLDDPLFAGNGYGVVRKILPLALKLNKPLGHWLSNQVTDRAQKKLEAIHYQVRKDLLKHDKNLNNKLSFSGRSE